MIRAVTTPAAATTRRRFTSSPMSPRLLVKNSSGTSANGMPKDRKTWLRTSALDGVDVRHRGDERGAQERQYRPDPAPFAGQRPLGRVDDAGLAR